MSDSTEKEKKEDEFSILNFNSIINFVQNNIIQLLLLMLVFIVIYVVDRITQFNNLLIAIQQEQMMRQQVRQIKKGKKKSK